jgi:hypothetical protein
VFVRRHGKCLGPWLHRFVLFGSGGFVPRGCEVLDANGAKLIGSFVRCSAGGALQGRVGAGFSGATGGDRTEVVFGAVLLCADGAGRLLRFAELGVVAVTLTITAVGSWSPRKIFGNTAFSVTEDKCVCT